MQYRIYTYTYIYISIYASIYISVYLSMRLSKHIYTYLSTYLCIYLHIYLSIFLPSIYLLVHRIAVIRGKLLMAWGPLLSLESSDSNISNTYHAIHLGKAHKKSFFFSSRSTLLVGEGKPHEPLKIKNIFFIKQKKISGNW